MWIMYIEYSMTRNNYRNCCSPFPFMKKAFRVEKWLTFRQYFIYQKQRTLGKNKWIGICAKYTKTSKNRSIFHGMVTISIVSVKIHQKYIHVLLHTNELSTMEFIYIQYNWKAIATEVFLEGGGGIPLITTVKLHINQSQ